VLGKGDLIFVNFNLHFLSPLDPASERSSQIVADVKTASGATGR